MLSLSFSTIVILISIAFFAGLVDSMAGGGGLITLPALLILGIPPHAALGTNKLQSSFGSFTASYNYAVRYRMIEKKFIFIGILFVAVGACIGALSTKFISQDNLKIIMVILLILLLLYLILKKDTDSLDKHQLISYPIFYILVGLALGAYDGFLGPGTGSFWTVAFISLLGFNLKKATAHTKIMNCTSNLASLAIFLYHGEVFIAAGLCMAIGQIGGAFLGSKLVYTINVKYVKLVLILSSAASLCKLATDLLS